MKFGLMPNYLAPMTSKEYATGYIRAAEECGFDSIWAPEHVVIPVGYKSRYPYARFPESLPTGGEGEKMPLDHAAFPDPVSMLAFWAATTDRLLLGTGVLILPQHNPVVLAKALATIDQLSGGRVRLGVGVGWNREEMETVGIPWADRGGRTDEYVAAMRALWGAEEANYEGRYVSLTRALTLPKPWGTKGIPVIVGGHSDAAARRAGRIGDGYWPNSLGGLPRLKEQLRIARAAAAEAGRDFDAIEVMTGGAPAPEQVRELAGLGVSRVIFAPQGTSPGAFDKELRALADRFVGQFGA